MAGAAESPGLERLHATAIALENRAVLIRGPSGSGKSDLALRCLTLGVSPLIPYAAKLVADDQVEVCISAIGLMASAPATLRGLIEVRGLGIVSAPSVAEPVPVRLVVDLAARAEIARLPDPPAETVVRGHRLPLLLVDPFEAAAAQKVLLGLMSAPEHLALA